MNKRIVIIISCLLLIPFSLSAQDRFKPGSEPNGFNSMRWGANISSFTDLEPSGSLPGETSLRLLYPEYTRPPEPFPEAAGKSYVRESDILKFEGVSIDEISYTFKNDKFCCVFISGRGEETFQQLTDVLIAKYGEAQFDNPSGSFFGGYCWKGNETEINLIFGAGDFVALQIASVKYQ